jgi:hypothetical protein
VLSQRLNKSRRRRSTVGLVFGIVRCPEVEVLREAARGGIAATVQPHH